MTELIGRLHPAIVHLPIGAFVLAFILQYLMPLKSGRQEVVRFILIVSFVFALLSSLFGWVLSWSSDYPQSVVDQHKWPAIVFTIASGLLIPVQHRATSVEGLRKFYHGLFMVSMLLLVVTGHRGGGLTHGDDYLSMAAFRETEMDKADTNRVKPDIRPSASTPVFVGLVQPVLEEKCVKCHNEKKLKGGLRMDQFDLLMKGGKNGAAVVAGDAANSLMIERVLLDPDDGKHMPPKGKKQLTEQEVALLHWWVAHGASAIDPIKAHVDDDTIKMFTTRGPEKPAAVLLLPEVKAPDSLSLVALVKAGYHVTPVAKGSHLLEISSINMPTLKDEDLMLLKPVAENILWLNLANRNITDKGIAHISACKNLQRLDLRHSKITDASAAQIGGLGSLIYLNMVGTEVSDAGLAQLNGLAGLKSLYCWETRITSTGVQSFTRVNPATKIYLAVN